MKTVIDINTLKPIQIRKDDIECSVCGIYHSPNMYNDKNINSRNAMVRTNCLTCYNLTIVKFQEMKEKVTIIKKSPKYTSIKNQLNHKLELNSSSVKATDLIKSLQTLPTDARVLIIAPSEAEDSYLDINQQFDLLQYNVYALNDDY